MTPLHLLDFQKAETILSHFDGVLGVFIGKLQLFDYFFANSLPLSLTKMAYLPFCSRLIFCKIRAIPHSDSGACRTPILGHSAHFFKMGREKNAG